MARDAGVTSSLTELSPNYTATNLQLQLRDGATIADSKQKYHSPIDDFKLLRLANSAGSQ